ncbi:38877_t:CDS:1, partial [Gigaspora margarita]
LLLAECRIANYGVEEIKPQIKQVELAISEYKEKRPISKETTCIVKNQIRLEHSDIEVQNETHIKGSKKMKEVFLKSSEKENKEEGKMTNPDTKMRESTKIQEIFYLENRISNKVHEQEMQ